MAEHSARLSESIDAGVRDIDLNQTLGLLPETFLRDLLGRAIDESFYNNIPALRRFGI